MHVDTETENLPMYKPQMFNLDNKYKYLFQNTKPTTGFFNMI